MMSEEIHCAGRCNLGTPTLRIVKCPECGSEVELFSTDVRVRCDNCGYEVYNDINLCVMWCRHAEECIGTEMYNRLVRDRQKVD